MYTVKEIRKNLEKVKEDVKKINEFFNTAKCGGFEPGKALLIAHAFKDWSLFESFEYDSREYEIEIISIEVDEYRGINCWHDQLETSISVEEIAESDGMALFEAIENWLIEFEKMVDEDEEEEEEEFKKEWRGVYAYSLV